MTGFRRKRDLTGILANSGHFLLHNIAMSG